MACLHYFRPPYLCSSVEYKYGVSIMRAINFCYTFWRTTQQRKTAQAWDLARLLIYRYSILSEILGFRHSKVLILVFDGVTVKTTNCVMGQCKMQTADWLRTIVFRVRKQWDYCCHVLICRVKTIVCSLRFTLTYCVILLFLFMYYRICCSSEYKIFIITRPKSPFGE